jgi:AcrR family transcriptional regulator
MPAKAGRYHHGDLRAALVDVAVELITERGVRGFSLAEASRRHGRSALQHFADRDQLLAAVAVRASARQCGACRRVAAASDNATTAVDRLIAAATGYVRCAATHRPLFQVLFGAGLDKLHHPEIDVAAPPVADAFLTRACAIRPEKAEAYELTLAVVATAHGHASLLLDGAFGLVVRAGSPSGVDG